MMMIHADRHVPKMTEWWNQINKSINKSFYTIRFFPPKKGFNCYLHTMQFTLKVEKYLT